MKQTVAAKQERPLLTYAISKLIPGVFSHPALIRFRNKEKPVPLGLLHDLLQEAENLQGAQPSDACQVLLICAVQQTLSGQRNNALTTLRKALDIAESAGLTQEKVWVIWGECAVSIQQGDYAQADQHFRHLQSALHEQNEWMLADYIDVVRQFFLSRPATETANYSSAAESLEFTSLFTSTIGMLYEWGSCSPTGFEAQTSPSASGKAVMTRPSFPTGDPQGPWHTLKLMIQGELKLHWMKSDPHPVRDPSSLWDSIRSWLAVHPSHPQTEPAIIDIDPQELSPSAPPTGICTTVPDPAPQEPEGEPEQDLADVHSSDQAAAASTVSVHMLGKFEMSIQDKVFELPASRNISVFKYLILNHKQSIPREVLMDVFWPDSEPDTARNNLNVAIHGIRRALHKLKDPPLILYKDGAYIISQETKLWLDVEEFESLVDAGQRLEIRSRAAAVSSYEAAISIYQGEFLQENPYEEWTVLKREHLRAAYLDTLNRLSQIYFDQRHLAACITVCQRILSYDPCREDAYCLLMRCYSRQGQDHLALRQYQSCAKALRAELEVEPAPETTKLYNRIKRHERV